MRPPAAGELPVPTVERATPDRYDDVVGLLPGGKGVGCLCQPWRGFDTRAMSGGRSRSELLLEQMAGDPPAPGYLAYLGRQPVGWIGVSVWTETPRLQRSRTIPAIDDRPVWAIGCFRIRPGFRRQGVATALLDGVIDAARREGAPGVEGYPVDPEGRRLGVDAGYVGIASMFDAAGFRRVLITGAHSGGLARVLMRIDFDVRS